MMTLLLGILSLLLGWALGWAHAIYMGKVDSTALLEECAKLDLEVCDLKHKLSAERALAPGQDS